MYVSFDVIYRSRQSFEWTYEWTGFGFRQGHEALEEKDKTKDESWTLVT